MKIAVIGAGGVGGPFGLALAQGGHDVTFVARGRHLDAMLSDGLRVEGARGDFHLTPTQATDDPAKIGPVDVVIVTVKLWDIETIGETLKPLIGPGTAVIPLQNGIDAHDALSRSLGAEHVMGGVAQINAVIEAPGLVRQMAKFQILTFGEMDGSRSPRGEAFLKACIDAGIDAKLSDNILVDLWEKFIFLTATSSVTAATRQRIGRVREHPETFRLLHEVMKEVCAIGLARGVPLDPTYPDRRFAQFEKQDPNTLASMAVDLLRGNKLELPWLAGRVVQLGEELGVPTPVTRVLHAVLLPYAEGRPADSPTG